MGILNDNFVLVAGWAEYQRSPNDPDIIVYNLNNRPLTVSILEDKFRIACDFNLIASRSLPDTCLRRRHFRRPVEAVRVCPVRRSTSAPASITRRSRRGVSISRRPTSGLGAAAGRATSSTRHLIPGRRRKRMKKTPASSWFESYYNCDAHPCSCKSLRSTNLI